MPKSKYKHKYLVTKAKSVFFNNKRRVIDVCLVEYVVLFLVHLVEEKKDKSITFLLVPVTGYFKIFFQNVCMANQLYLLAFQKVIICYYFLNPFRTGLFPNT